MAITADRNGSWSERNIADIADCMDRAFANVLSAEFTRLTADMSRNQIDTRLYRSKRSIGRLRNSDDMPDYSDPMVVLRYVILYQLGHINLAYTLIKKDEHRGRRLTDTGALHVVDFGAGTLAMSFGAALAVADALDDGANISAVTVDAIDTGRPMMELGVKLWNEFANQASPRQGMELLTRAAQLIHHSLHDNHRSVQKLGNSACWLSSLHTLYDDNEDTVRSALNTLCGMLNPDLVVLTCFAGKSDIANRVTLMGRNWQRAREPQLLLGGYIDDSCAAGVAFERGFQPPTWHNRRLYTDVFDAATFISRAEASRPSSGPRRPPTEAERLRDQQRRAEEIQRREAQERERQRQQQEEARRHSDRVEHQGQQERWRKIQEEASQRLEQERQQRRQESEAQRHSSRGIPSKIRSGLSLLFRRRRK